MIDRMILPYYDTFGTFDLVPQLFSVGLQPDFSGTGLLIPCAGDMLAVPSAVAFFGASILLVSQRRRICYIQRILVIPQKRRIGW